MLLYFKLRISHAYFLSNDGNELKLVFSKCCYSVIKIKNKTNIKLTLCKLLCVFYVKKQCLVQGFLILLILNVTSLLHAAF